MLDLEGTISIYKLVWQIEFLGSLHGQCRRRLGRLRVGLHPRDFCGRRLRDRRQLGLCAVGNAGGRSLGQ